VHDTLLRKETMKCLNDAGGRFKLPLKDDAGKTLCTLL
jgi:hypothetical protein